LHDDSSDNLLANEISVYPISIQSSIYAFPHPIAPLHCNPPLEIFDVPDLNLVQASLSVLVNVNVDWEMCVDVSHLVFEALGDTDDQVVDECADGSEGSDVLSGTVVQLDVDDILLWVGEVDSQMLEVLGELAYATVNFLSLMNCFNRCLPRGPSTVTILDLMVTLTIRAKTYQYVFPFQCAHTSKPRILSCGPRRISGRAGGAIVLTTLGDVQGLFGMNVLHFGTCR
jgi:hypothetical protein